MLDALFFIQNLPGFNISCTTFGMPRVGNQAFADYLSNQPSLTLSRVIYGDDPIPILPDPNLGYWHPVGEIHIVTYSETWIACTGAEEDNVDPVCEDSLVPDISHGNLSANLGPYNGVYFGGDYCS